VKHDKTEISFLNYKGRVCLPAVQTASCWQLLGKHRLFLEAPEGKDIHAIVFSTIRAFCNPTTYATASSSLRMDQNTMLR